MAGYLGEVPNEVLYIASAIAGGVSSLSQFKKLQWRGKVGVVVPSSLFGICCGPYVSEYLSASVNGTVTIHFLLGLGGLALIGCVVTLVQSFKQNPIAKLADFFTYLSKKEKEK